MHASVGVSTSASAIRAAIEAARAARSRTATPEVALVFAAGGPAQLPAEVLSAVAEVTGAATVVGASGVGVLSADGEVEGDAVGVALLWDVGARAALGEGLSRDSDQAAARALHGLDLAEQGALLLLFDAMRVMPSLTAALRRQVPLAVPVLGFGAVDAAGTPWVAASAEAPVADAVVALWLRSARATWAVASVGQPVTPLLRVTGAKGGVIDTLEDRPALDVLREAVRGPLMADLERLGRAIFVGLTGPGGVEIVRPLLGIDPYVGALAIGGAPVREGQHLRFLLRSPEQARENLQAALAQLQADLPAPPRLLLVARAAGRGAELYGELAGIEAALIAGAFPGVPLLGLLGACELAPAAEGHALHFFTTTIIALA